MQVQLALWSNIVITIAAIANLLLFAGLVIFAFKLKGIVQSTVDSVLDKTLPRVQPVLDNVSEVTGKVSDIVEKVAPKVEHMAADSEDTVHSVTSHVKTTSTIVTENVAKPIVNIASLLTGVQRGIEVWKTAKETQDTHPDHDGHAYVRDVEDVEVMSEDGRAVPPETAAHA